MTNLESLIQSWRDENSEVLPPVRPEVVVAAFESLGQTATSDVIALYGRCGGMWEMDSRLWRLWPLEDIVRGGVEQSNFGIVFGDYCLDCWWYRLHSVSAEVSAVYVDDGTEAGLQQVAASVNEFIEGLWRDADEMLHRPRSRES